MKPTRNDPVIDDIRGASPNVSSRCYDPRQLVAYYIRRQRRYRDRLIVSDIHSHSR